MNFITLKELKKMVPVASEFKRVPGLKKILEDGIEVILRKQMENHAEVVVYKNGYVSYHAHERYTVFALHNCTHYYYESQGNEHQTIPHNHFEDMEWHIRLVLEGEDRLVRNLEARESETFSYAADVNPEYNNEMEDPRINVMDFVLNKEFLRKASELLKKHQWEMICRHYIEGMTHREIAAEMGVSHQYVTKGIKKGLHRIIYQTTEDDADDTVVPRFNSAGGDGENLIFIKEDEKTLSFGDNRIREAIEKYNAKLLILDPLSSYIGENCSMNNANETRAEFNHLIAVAKDTGCAIVIIAHMNKMKDNNPLYRTNGSIDIAGAARSILAITRTPNKEAPAERYLVQVKSNLAPTGSAILFEVAEKGVNFISEMEMTAEEAFLSLAPQIGRPNEKEMKAKSFLIEMLQGGEMLSSDCEEKLEAAGFKKSTIKKAKKNAGVISKKKGFLWYWSLPMSDIPRE